jgi:hypothetical protein
MFDRSSDQLDLITSPPRKHYTTSVAAFVTNGLGLSDEHIQASFCLISHVDHHSRMGIDGVKVRQLDVIHRTTEAPLKPHINHIRDIPLRCFSLEEYCPQRDLFPRLAHFSSESVDANLYSILDKDHLVVGIDILYCVFVNYKVLLGGKLRVPDTYVGSSNWTNVKQET